MKQVKLFFLVCSFLSIFSILYNDLYAQDSSKYHGGSYDGFSNGNITQTTLNGNSLNANKYFGGSYDGFSLNNISQTSLNGTSANLAKYFGGSYDGFSLINISQSTLNGSTINLAKYFGGSYDGFSLFNIPQSSLDGSNVNLAKYFGGSYDGFSLNTILQTSLGGSNVNFAKYFGGSYDGFSLSSILQTTLGGISINLAKYFGGSYDGFAVASVPASTLPVILSSFLSSVKLNNVKLEWTTENEFNNSGFKVEQLKLGEINWKELGFVIGNGTTNEQKKYLFDDKKLQTATYKYRLKQINFNGNFEYFNLDNDVVVGTPKDFRVSQNYPNPSNPKSKIDYELPVNGKLSIKVYDIIGREVVKLIDEYKEAGYYTVDFDGSNFASGVYFYKIVSGAFIQTKKMILIK
jgi:hypothetical protein